MNNDDYFTSIIRIKTQFFIVHSLLALLIIVLLNGMIR
jgi:hypothetical protein